MVEALQMYADLMKEMPTYGYAGLPKPNLQYPPNMIPPQVRVKSVTNIIIFEDVICMSELCIM